MRVLENPFTAPASNAGSSRFDLPGAIVRKAFFMHKHLNYLAFAITIAAAFYGPVHAESPMVTDDAGTLDAKGAKIEAGLFKAGASRSGALALAYAPVENLELGLSHARTRDTSTSPGTHSNTDGLAVKWIPLHQGPLSAGFKLELARTGQTDAAPSVRSTAVTGLLSYQASPGYVLHANLGRGWDRSADSATQASTRWSMGAELPVAANVQLTGDFFGATGDTPGKQIGLRWTVKEGIKLFAGVGRSNSETIANAGVAWEF
jgi:hypothetical protein